MGPAGQTGPTGARGPIAATIPFSISGNGYGQGVQISSDGEGKPLEVNFAGFGTVNGYQPAVLKAGEWDAGLITIDENGSFPNSFMMPFDGILRNIYVVFASRQGMYIPTGVTMRPFVCLGISDCTSLSFQILKETITYTEPYVGNDEEVPKYSLRSGFRTDFALEITKGTLVVIVVGWMGEGETLAHSALISVSGGIFVD